MMKFVLAGNPNSGKTTLFNALTGNSARVGNWPGVTVDKKEGIYRLQTGNTAEKISIVDLPGIYSLSPYTPEEVVARQFIMDEKPDLIINIVDSTNLERNLYLTTQLLETDIPVVVALNMMDVIEREGSKIDVGILALKLQVPVVPVSALKSSNVHLLMQRCAECAKNPRRGSSILQETQLGNRYQQAMHLVEKHNIPHPAFHAVKLLENDSIELLHNTQLSANIQALKLEYETGDKPFDYEAEIADLRYRFITSEIKPAAVKLLGNGSLSKSEKIDRLLTHRFWGIPLFLCAMFAIFHLVFAGDFLYLQRFALLDEGLPGIGVFFQGLVEDLNSLLSDHTALLLDNAGATDWAKGLIVNGLLNGVCSVLTFLPQIMLLFFFLSLLEDSGYMSRIAFITDRAMRRFGLSGRAILPMLMGFGCSVPAMTGTRTLENIREKRLTLMLIPFFSCGAKTGVWTVIVAAFFPQNAEAVVFMIFLIGIVAAFCGALILKKTVFGRMKPNFVLELPVYRMPRMKNTVRQLWHKLKGFVLQVTTIIAASTILIWFLQNFDFHLRMISPDESARSILGVIGSSIQWIFEPLGFASGADGWKPVVAIIAGLIAKEAVIATMGVLYIPSFENMTGNDALLSSALASMAVFSPVSAFSFMVFNLLTIPCFAAVATAYAEMQSRRWFCFAVVFWLAAAWLTSFAVYRIGLLLHDTNLANIVIFLLALVIVILAFTRRKNSRHNNCGNCDCGNCGKC
ncbi:MAG: ferrous iron transport protein B [Prevotellaceae bacterium]|jgi:ferrous iron transport protein B|nr:ferrous iron transport protein B [Prevotellaceae bacterium]